MTWLNLCNKKTHVNRYINDNGNTQSTSTYATAKLYSHFYAAKVEQNASDLENALDTKFYIQLSQATQDVLLICQSLAGAFVVNSKEQKTALNMERVVQTADT